MKAFKYLTLLATALVLGLASCSDDDENNTPDKQTYQCRLKFETEAPTDSAKLKDEVFMQAFNKECTDLANSFQKAFNITDETFSVQAKDSISMKKEVLKFCQEAEKNINTKVWNTYHKIYVCWDINEKESTPLYAKTFGEANGQNDDALQFHYMYLTEGIKSYLWGTFFTWENKERSTRMDFLCRLGTTNKVVKEDSWSLTDCDLNKGVWGKDVYIKGKRWDGELYTIGHVVMLKTDSPKGTDFKVRYNGNLYGMAERFSGSSGDLNQDAGGSFGTYLYLMHTKRNTTDGNYLSSLDAVEGTREQFKEWVETKREDCQFAVPTIDENGKKIDDFANTNLDNWSSKNLFLVGTYSFYR